MPEKRYWFRKKSSGMGWGWTLGSREGWIATLIFSIVSLAGIALLIPLAVKTSL
jgi:hypothetical protein